MKLPEKFPKIPRKTLVCHKSFLNTAANSYPAASLKIEPTAEVFIKIG